MKKTHFILFLILCVSVSVFAQNPFIKNYTIADGLPTNKIAHICQDSQGFLWFSSNAGVMKYDGNTFKNYTVEDGLSDNFVIRIREDKSGRLWFLNMNGTVNFLYKNKIYNSKDAPFLAELESNTYLLDFYEDADSTLYFYNSGAEVFAVKNNQLVDYSSLRVDAKKDKILFHVNKTKTDHFLFWTAKGAYEYKNLDESIMLYATSDPIQKVLKVNDTDCVVINRLGEIDYFEGAKKTRDNFLTLESVFINAVVKDQNGYLWFATYNKGVYCYNNNKEILHLDINVAQSILVDGENNIWITSAKSGIFKINAEILKSKHLDKNEFDLKGINKIAKANDGGLWVTNGESIFLIKNHQLFPRKIKTSDNILKNIFQFPDNTLIANGVGTQMHIIENVKVNLENKTIQLSQTKVTNYTIKDIAVDLVNNRLYSFMNDNIMVVNTENFKNDVYQRNTGRIRNVFMDRNNNLIVNASKNYLISNNSFSYYYPLEEFDGQTIVSHEILNKENEVFNIAGNNIYILNNDSLYNLTRNLQTKIDYNIKELAYNGSTLFFSTSKTIYFITNPLEIIQNKPIQFNKLNIEFDNINDIYCEDSTLYIASDNGLTFLPIKDALNVELVTPVPYFKNISLNEEKFDFLTKSIEFKSSKRLSLEFASLNYSSSASEFAYKLDGIDKNWIEGKETNVVYFNLAPGKYIFKVKVRKISEDYSDTIELPVQVNPTFFQRTSVKILIALTLIGLIFIIIQSGYKRKLKQKETDNLLITLEHKALQSMMNPHFIFNSLGSIQRYLLENKAAEAGTYLSQFARLIRQNMNSLKQNYICIDDEVERLRNYIDLEKFRMNNKFEYEILIDSEIDGYDITIPSMIVQPFVENAIWHGISSIKNKGKILVSFKPNTEKSIYITIEDNGIGISNSLSFSKSKSGLNMGVSLTEKRLKLIGDKFGVESAIHKSEINTGTENPGTRIEIITPIIKAE